MGSRLLSLLLAAIAAALLPAADAFHKGDSFCYFAYGSNLLDERIHIKNPTATLVGIAELDGFELGFGGHSSKTWHGFPATIRRKNGARVMGAVWRLGNENSESLDIQEGLNCKTGGYNRLDVLVRLLGPSEHPLLQCRSYQLKQNDVEGLPSPAYKSVIVTGARRLGLPRDYMDKLEAVETNDYDGPIGIPIAAIHAACDGDADH